MKILRVNPKFFHLSEEILFVELTAHADAKKSRENYGIMEITFI
jgi:hypothetical protein